MQNDFLDATLFALRAPLGAESALKFEHRLMQESVSRVFESGRRYLNADALQQLQSQKRPSELLYIAKKTVPLTKSPKTVTPSGVRNTGAPVSVTWLEQSFSLQSSRNFSRKNERITNGSI